MARLGLCLDRHFGDTSDMLRYWGASQRVRGGAAVSFFCLAVIIGGVALAAWLNSRPWDGTAVIDGKVAAVYEPPWFDDGQGKAWIQYYAGDSWHQFERGWNSHGHQLRTDEVLPVEYVIAKPSKARTVWQVEDWRGRVRPLASIAGGLGALGLIALISYVIGERRLSRR